MDLKPLGDRDTVKLFEWRRQAEESPWYQGRPVDRRAHGRWVKDRIRNPAVKIWLCTVDNMAVGVLRVDSNGEVTVTIDDALQGRGYGAQALEAAKQYSGQHRLKACIDETNHRARNILMRAGFERRTDVEFWLWQR